MNISGDKLAEESTLSACIQSIAARKEARRHIDREDFLYPQHMTIWDALSKLDREQQPVDLMTVNTAVRSDAAATAAMLEVVSNQAIPDNVQHYAETVRGWAVRRRLYDEATRVQQSAANLDVDPAGLASSVVTRFSQIRDTGITEDAQSITLGELLESPDDQPEWVIPGLLERRDRLILTGQEGLGKSFLLRQIAIMAAAGLDPFDQTRAIKPAKVLIVDCENSLRQVKRKARGIVEFAQRWGTGHPEQVNLLCTGRIDILRDKDLSMIHREIEVVQPDIIVIGPIYAMSPKALMTDDDAVPVLAALDGMREGGAALLMEAHAGHAMDSHGRNLRPRGSASLMGWPEFGYGLKAEQTSGYASLVPWRGDRDSRDWPKDLKYDREGIRWVVHDGRGYDAEPWNARGIA